MQMRAWRCVLFLGMVTFLTLSSSPAQIDNTFRNIFDEILKNRLRLSPGMHGNHFIEAADIANSSLTPALNSLIVSNISSFPLSSTIAGVSFDFSKGVPVSTIEGLGPIFSETAETIGKGKLNVGFGFTHLNLSRLRGLPTDQMRFTFAHVDVSPDDTLGDVPFESDYIDLYMDLHINANIYAFYATYGVSNVLDIGLAIPLINVNINGKALARINSFTYPRLGAAFHNFGPDSLNPVFETVVPYEAGSTGLGDVALRVKYSFVRGRGIDFAELVDLRIPTGKQEDFLGTGKGKLRLLSIASKRYGDFRPHVNLGYEFRFADFESDIIDIKAGFDQKLTTGLTFALDVLSTFAVDETKTAQLFPGSRDVYYRVSQIAPGQYIQHLDLSNVPERSNDNQASLSTGFRFAPSEEVVFLANVLMPLNDGGLYAMVTPSFGFSINL